MLTQSDWKADFDCEADSDWKDDLEWKAELELAKHNVGSSSKRSCYTHRTVMQ